jgi:hypothetical protein
MRWDRAVPGVRPFPPSVSRSGERGDEAEPRRGFGPVMQAADRAKGRSVYFDNLLDARVREFRPPSLLPRPKIPLKHLPTFLRHGRILDLHAGQLFPQCGDVDGDWIDFDQVHADPCRIEPKTQRLALAFTVFEPVMA